MSRRSIEADMRALDALAREIWCTLSDGQRSALGRAADFEGGACLRGDTHATVRASLVRLQLVSELEDGRLRMLPLTPRGLLVRDAGRALVREQAQRRRR